MDARTDVPVALNRGAYHLEALNPPVSNSDLTVRLHRTRASLNVERADTREAGDEVVVDGWSRDDPLRLPPNRRVPFGSIVNPMRAHCTAACRERWVNRCYAFGINTRAMTIDPERLRELTAELGFMPATTDATDIERRAGVRLRLRR